MDMLLHLTIPRNAGVMAKRTSTLSRGKGQPCLLVQIR
jgi:hypothetical protein